MKKDAQVEEILDIEIKELKSMTKDELIASYQSLQNAIGAMEQNRIGDQKLIESMRDNSIKMQEEFQEMMDDVNEKVNGIVKHYEAKIEGITGILKSAVTLAEADKEIK